MKQITLMALVLLFLGGCATTTPLEARREAILECTKTFMEYDAAVSDASNACIRIYRKQKTGYVKGST